MRRPLLAVDRPGRPPALICSDGATFALDRKGHWQALEPVPGTPAAEGFEPEAEEDPRRLRDPDEYQDLDEVREKAEDG